MRQWWGILGALAIALAGCDGPFGEPSAASNEASALMAVALPGWKAEGPALVRQITVPGVKGQPAESGFFVLSPGPVVNLDDQRAMLVVVGKPSDAEGNSLAGHASSAVLSAYPFALRGGRWVAVGPPQVFGQEGYFGEPGDLKPVDLGGGVHALAVENGSCWQGFCGRWLTLYAVVDGRFVSAYSDALANTSAGASEHCEELLALKPGQTMRVSLAEYPSAYGCYQIDGTWSIVPEAGGPGTLQVIFQGMLAKEKAVPFQPAAGAAKSEDDPEEEYLVTMQAVNDTQRYRYAAGKYVLLSGKNPNPGF